MGVRVRPTFSIAKLQCPEKRTCTLPLVIVMSIGKNVQTWASQEFILVCMSVSKQPFSDTFYVFASLHLGKSKQKTYITIHLHVSTETCWKICRSSQLQSQAANFAHRLDAALPPSWLSLPDLSICLGSIQLFYVNLLFVCPSSGFLFV